MNGKAYKFGDNISTDLIISGRYKFAIQDPNELAKHVMEDADTEFASKITPKQAFIVAGDNWGMGSSREQAPIAIKYAGVNAVLAKSFARIFYRNAINVGLPLIQCDTDQIDEGDEIDVDLTTGKIKNLTKNTEMEFKALPDFLRKILESGGIIEYLKANGGFKDF